MKQPAILTTLGLAVTLAACGGRAVGPSGSGRSHLTVDDGNAKHEVSGVTFAQRDPGQRRFVVYTFHEKTEPRPSCALLASPQNMIRGGFISLVVASFEGAPGRYTADQTGVFLGDPDKGDITMLSQPLAGTSVTLRSFDDTSFSGEVTSTGAAPKVSGSFSGTICPGSAGSAVTVGAAPAEERPVETAKPAVVPGLDADGVLGIKLGQAPKTFPKGVSKQARQPSWPQGTELYAAKGISYLGTPIERADIVVVDGVVVQVAAQSARCEALLAKLIERYGEGEKSDFVGMGVWRGERTVLRLGSHHEGKCVLTLDKESSLL
ncbi:MAG: hypothetical protein KF795_12640 [Labilithrix sp.]|nr:hypothetical protein [Labilithrix sp.]